MSTPTIYFLFILLLMIDGDDEEDIDGDEVDIDGDEGCIDGDIDDEEDIDGDDEQMK